jgi:glycosyltransferase involved in cell wall biosynthesis
MTTSDGVPPIAIVHDYLATMGGAERFVLSLHRAFPHAPIYTSLFEPSRTYSDFKELDIHPSAINRSSTLRSHYRLAFPFLASTFSRMHIPARVLICSSSGWAHGASTDGTKLVYCHSPARWIYKPEDYFRPPTYGGLTRSNTAVRERIHTSPTSKLLIRALRPRLRRWDVAAARSATRYFANSSVIAEEIHRYYQLDATVLPPPSAFGDHIEEMAVATPPPAMPLEDGFYLIVSRLERYKNIAPVIEAFAQLPQLNLVIAGSGPQAADLRRRASANVHFMGRVTDDELRWLYGHCEALIAPANEDYGLTPVEAAGFGKPTLALRGGGYLDTVHEGTTGLYFDDVDPVWIARVVEKHRITTFDRNAIIAHSEQYSETAFIQALRSYVEPYLDQS